jgi:hypothetical protein
MSAVDKAATPNGPWHGLAWPMEWCVGVHKQQRPDGTRIACVLKGFAMLCDVLEGCGRTAVTQK